MIDQTRLHYRVVEKLGGGRLVVCKAEDKRRHRFVARNVPPQEVSKEPQALERFQREPLATSALNHPNRNPGRGGGAWV
jgi:serine/threonine protein kinase